MSFDEIFETYHPEVYRYVQRLTGRPEEAADITQETFRRLLEQDERPDDVKGWLVTVALNQVRDRVRTRSRRRDLAAGEDLLPDAPERPDQTYGRRERVSEARRALDTLNERDRRMLLLREEGFKYREIAEMLGVKTGSVGTMLARALEQFAEAYDGPEPHETPEPYEHRQPRGDGNRG